MMRRLFFALFTTFCLLGAPAAEAVSVPIVCFPSQAEALVKIPNHKEVGSGTDYFSNQFHLYFEEETGKFAIGLTMRGGVAHCFMVDGENFALLDADDPANDVQDYDKPYTVFGRGDIPDTDFELEIHVEKGPARRFYIVVYDEKSSQTLVIGLMWVAEAADLVSTGTPI